MPKVLKVSKVHQDLRVLVVALVLKVFKVL